MHIAFFTNICTTKSTTNNSFTNTITFRTDRHSIKEKYSEKEKQLQQDTPRFELFKKFAII
jgi:hypothetical protein